MSSLTATTLRRAKSRIRPRENWTQGAGARNGSGNLTAPMSIDACQWCATGAVAAVVASSLMYSAAVMALAAVLQESTETGWESIETGWESIVIRFNDHRDTTHADVLALFDRAIAAAEKA